MPGRGLARLRVTHWSTRLGAALGALAAIAIFGPVFIAALMLRCCSDSTGPTWGAWVVAGVILLVLVVVGGAIGAGVFVAVRKGWAAIRGEAER